MTADVLRRAADAMDAEADRLDAMEQATFGDRWEAKPSGTLGDVPIAATSGEAWDYICSSPDDGVRGGHDEADADLIVHRRNTLARDAATLRAQAALLRMVAARHAELLSNFRDDSEAARLIAWTNTPFMSEAERAAQAFLGEPAATADTPPSGAPQPPAGGGHVHRMSS